MDIRSYFLSSSTPSTSVAPSNRESSNEEERDIPPSKKSCISTPDSEHSKKQSKYRTTSTSSSRKYQKRWEKTLLGWNMMLIVTEHSVNCVRHMEEHPLNEQVVYGQRNKAIHQLNKAVEKMKAYASSNGHIQANHDQAALAHLTTQHTGSVIQLPQNVAEQE